MSDRKVTVHLPGDCATSLTRIAEREGRTLAGELLWLAVKRVQRMGGSKVAKGKNDDEVKVTVRMPRELADGLRRVAEQQDRTLGAEVRRLIRVALDHDQPLAEPDPLTGQ